MEQRELLKYVIDVLDQQQLTYMLVGSFASAYFGEPRQTFDIDVVIELTREDVPGLSSDFQPPQFYLSEPTIYEAIRLGAGSSMSLMLPPGIRSISCSRGKTLGGASK